MRNFLLLLVSVPLLCHAQQKEKSIEIMLPVKKAHEECMDMKPGQVLQYRFEATAELDFNLHYHVGKEVITPANGNYSIYSDSYSAKEKNAYCLMWTNKSGAPVKLQTTYQIISQ